MRHLPRERFAPAQKRALAYADLEIEVADGRFLMRPRDLAKLIQALAPQPHERGLEIAGATGYGAAVLAACCKEVVALEPDGDLSFAARTALESAAVANVKTVSTAVAEGWKGEAPYDVMLLNGAAEVVPNAWLKQLAPGGRLGVIVREGHAGAARIYTAPTVQSPIARCGMRSRRWRRAWLSRAGSRSDERCRHAIRRVRPLS